MSRDKSPLATEEGSGTLYDRRSSRPFMSENYPYIEQDQNPPPGGDGLPTYDDLAAQNGPNSRFGRWRGWIEKRAAERYADLTSEERERRRQRGWDLEDVTESPVDVQASSTQVVLNTCLEPPTPVPGSLFIQTEDLQHKYKQPTPPLPSPPLPPLPFISQRLPPTHLKLNHFGSRFLPHTTSQIRCLLPLPFERLLLIGHDEGLSVLDLFPQEWHGTGGITVKGPDEAQARLIWRGESVYQMSILEMENTGEGTPQGVILALVAPEPNASSSKEPEVLRTLRMYNLASLTSLAKWTASQKGARPLDLHRPSNWQAQQTPTKRHRPQSSIARSLKSLIDSPGNHHTSHNPEPSSSSYHRLLSPSPSTSTNNGRTSPISGRTTPRRGDSAESGWDVIEDLPLRWATDFVPLASPGSRLVGTSVISYALWNENNRRGKGGQMLAVATKSNIFLYETPKGERAFHFVKEFYTPLQPKTIAFFQQSVQDIARSSSTTSTRSTTHVRSGSAGTIRGDRHELISPSGVLNYDTQLSLFVIFEKKAGWIRLADSAVGEVELYDDGNLHLHPVTSRESLSSPTSFRRSRISIDCHPTFGKWLLPAKCDLPVFSSRGTASTRGVYLFTRGKVTHILPSPLPVSFSAYQPLHVVTWKSTPTSVLPRVCDPTSLNIDSVSPYLQLVAMGESGVEVHEVSLSFLNKGKGKGPSVDSLWAEEDIGGDTGFLCTGGHWDQPHYGLEPHRHGLNRSYSAASDKSAASFDSLTSEEIVRMLKQQEGMYGWCRKGLEDWRVFWVGGSLIDDPEDDADELRSEYV